MQKPFKEYKEELVLTYKKYKFYVKIFIKDFMIETWNDIKNLPINFWEFIKRITNMKNIFWVVFSIILFTLVQGLNLTLILGTIVLIIILIKRARSGEYVARERKREKQRAEKYLIKNKIVAPEVIEEINKKSGTEVIEENLKSEVMKND